MSPREHKTQFDREPHPENGDGAGGDYNAVFETLVQSDTDLTGMIAYARYKRSKKDWLVQRLDRDRSPPSPQDYQTFIESYLDPHNLSRLRAEADAMLADYGNSVLKQAEPAIRENALQNETLTQARRTLTRTEKQGIWWRQMSLAALGAFAYSLLLLALALILRILGVDLLDVLAVT